jgi:EmrB/QacA subfamily drug resistance transporter
MTKHDNSITAFGGLQTKWWVLIAIGTSTFMSALDTSVVNTILPVIQNNFGSDVATIEWIVTVYLLVVSGLLLSFGRLGDIRGHKPVFLTGFIIFIIASALCGLAPSAGSLIAFRAIQAIGAAMLAANSPAILTDNFPDNQRGQALGLQATMTYLGLTVAPSFGGWLTHMFSWRAVFYINIPVGLTALYLSWRFIPTDSPAKVRERFDSLGAFTFIIGLVLLLVGLNQGHAWGWTSLNTLGTLITAGALLFVFLLIESHSKHPMLDLKLFHNRVFSASVATAVINYICVFSIIFLMPFYLIQGRDLNPAQAGLILTIQPIIMAIVAPLSGTLSDRIGIRWPCITGMTILAIGLFLLSKLRADTSYAWIAFSLVLTGTGTGTFISPNNSAIMGSAPPGRRGIAAGILATARSVGMVLGIGIAGAIFTTILAHAAVEMNGNVFFLAIQTTFLVTSVIASLGVITAAVRQ